MTSATPNGLNAVFAAPVAPGNHCSCVYRDGQLVASYDGAPGVRPFARFFGSTDQLSFRSLNANGVIVLVIGSTQSLGVPLPGIAYELWVNPILASVAVTTDANAFFSYTVPSNPSMSGQTLGVQALDLSAAVPTFTNDVVLRFP